MVTAEPLKKTLSECSVPEFNSSGVTEQIQVVCMLTLLHWQLVTNQAWEVRKIMFKDKRCNSTVSFGKKKNGIFYSILHQPII